MTAKKGKGLGVKALLTKAFGAKAAAKAAPKAAATKNPAKHSTKPVATKAPAKTLAKASTKAVKSSPKIETKQLAKNAAKAVSKPTPKNAVDKPAAKTDKKKQSGASVQNNLQTVSSGRVGRAGRNSPAVCREVACELLATTGNYCRMHYIKNWKKIKRKEMILKERKLNHYIEELVSKYPDKYIEAIRQDLENEKDFAKVIADLEIDETMDDFESVETESAEGIIDNIKRDFDDSDDVF